MKRRKVKSNELISAVVNYSKHFKQCNNAGIHLAYTRYKITFCFRVLTYTHTHAHTHIRTQRINALLSRLRRRVLDMTDDTRYGYRK